MDFAGLPPEINSGRMYSGAGSGPLLAAAQSWSNLAAELTTTATGIRSTVTALAAAWMGPSADAMTAATMRYAAWLSTTADQAAVTAGQAQAAAAAYETAFAAVVPPELVAGNRTQLAALVASNLLGQNTAAIAATEAAYAEMWAQDAAAMDGYAASSAAIQLTPFTASPQVTSPAGSNLANTAASVDLTPSGWLGQLLLSSLSSGGLFEIPLQLLGLFSVLWGVSSPDSPLSQAITNRINNGGAVIIPEYPAPPATSTARAPVTASLGAGRQLGGRLSVPPNWGPLRGAEPPAATPIPPAKPGGPMPMPLPIPAGGTPNKTPRPEPDYGIRPTVMPKHPY